MSRLRSRGSRPAAVSVARPRAHLFQEESMSSMKSVLSVSAVGLCLSLASSAQSASPAPTQALGQVWTNLGELRAPTKGEHVLTGKALAIHGLETVRAELAPYA